MVAGATVSRRVMLRAMDNDDLRSAVVRAMEATCERRMASPGPGIGLDGLFGLTGYSPDDLQGLPSLAARLSTARGHPIEVAELQSGESVLDVGCGVGLDLLLASRLVAPRGRLFGVDLSVAVCARAREVLSEAGVEEALVREGLAEKLPIADESIDVVTSNGLVTLSPEPGRVLQEMARVLRPGGRFILADVSLVEPLPGWAKLSRGLFSAGVVGARSTADLVGALQAAGFGDVEPTRQLTLDMDQLEIVLDAGNQALEVAGCSASGAIMDSEAAAALVGHVGVVTLRATKLTA